MTELGSVVMEGDFPSTVHLLRSQWLCESFHCAIRIDILSKVEIPSDTDHGSLQLYILFYDITAYRTRYCRLILIFTMYYFRINFQPVLLHDEIVISLFLHHHINHQNKIWNNTKWFSIGVIKICVFSLANKFYESSKENILLVSKWKYDFIDMYYICKITDYSAPQ